eukprot:gene46400-62848_t
MVGMHLSPDAGVVDLVENANKNGPEIPQGRFQFLSTALALLAFQLARNFDPLDQNALRGLCSQSGLCLFNHGCEGGGFADRDIAQHFAVDLDACFQQAVDEDRI